VNVVVIGWPSGSLETAAFERVITATTAVGHDVTTVDLVKDGFQAAMPRAERELYHEQRVDPPAALAPYVAAVRAAEALVFVYPTIASSVPPVVRGWLERVMLPGVAFVFDERSGRVRPGLGKVRTIVGVATYPDSWLTTKAEHDNGRRLLLRALRLNTGLRTRTKWVGCYDAPGADDVTRNRFLARVEAAVTQL